MARGTQSGEDDGTWRPSVEDDVGDDMDEILEEDMIDEEPKKGRNAASRASPRARKKKSARSPKTTHPPRTVRSPRHQQDDGDDDDDNWKPTDEDLEDDTWKPTDEDLEDEELEVEEIGNDDLLDEEQTHDKPKKHIASKVFAHRPKPQAQTNHEKYGTSNAAGRKPEVHQEPQYEDGEDDAPHGIRGMLKMKAHELAHKLADKISDKLHGESSEEHQGAKPEFHPEHQSTTASNQKPSKYQEGETWNPAGEELEEEDEEPEDEYEDSVYDTPKKRKSKPSRKAHQQPLAVSAESPDYRKASKPGPRPKHQLTTASNKKPPEFLIQGQNSNALFTFAAYRGEGMCMLAMNWKNSTPPDEFVGFVIEYQEPGSSKWWPIPNYLSFPGEAAHTGPDAYSSRLSPIQRFRWIHFPFTIDIPGHFHYRVTPAFMEGGGDNHSLSYGAAQEVAIELMAETYPGKMNVAFTRGFISSKAFTKKYGSDGGLGTILPQKADEGLDFKAKDPEIEEKALSWMGFEARQVVLNALDTAIQDTTAEVRLLAYDFNNPEIVLRLKKLGRRLKIIIDDSGSHGGVDDAESKAAEMLRRTAGQNNVQRQHMGGLQHNKVFVVDGARTKIAIGGSTNFSWRGLYVQNNNLVALQGAQPVRVFTEAFDNYWNHPNDTDGFYKGPSSEWKDLGLKDVDAQVTFSPHSSNEGTLDGIASDIAATESSLFYSLAFLYETPGVIREAIQKKTSQKGVMVYGLSDKSVDGLDVQHNGNPPIAYPEDFDNEAAGGSGARMHHKFVVIDFNKPTARVYTGSHNFSTAADTKNAENLFLIRDQRVATAYMIEAVSMFDHYVIRDHVEKKKTAEAKGEKHTIHLRLPPQKKGEKPWWDQYWSVKQKSQDREMFGI